jgi:hypothetical protein
MATIAPGNMAAGYFTQDSGLFSCHIVLTLLVILMTDGAMGM